VADRRSILVTGIPRSGTTWVARLLAQSPATAMLGREPMNPRPGQYALGGRLHGWVRLVGPDDQVGRTLRRVYAGRDPRTLGRYGHRQWRLAASGGCVVVKDPFALLSIRAVCEVTGAVPVVVYRSAAETLSSYRRMGWTADTEEFATLGASAAPEDDVAAMAEFWSWGYRQALDDLSALREAGHPYAVVSHAELTASGVPGQNLLRGTVGLDPVPFAPPAPEQEPAAEPDQRRVDSARLHNLDRSPEEVLAGARAHVSAEEAGRLEELTGATWTRLAAQRLLVTPSQTG
jgi:hypothetical protein